MALPFVIVPSYSLKAAVIMSAFIFAATIPCATLAPVLKPKIKTVYLVPLCSIIAMCFVMLTRYALSGYAVLLDALGLYIPLVAVNSIMLEISVINTRKTPLKGFCDAVLMCMGFALVACSIGTLREVLGERTIWDIPFGIYPIKLVGVKLPFFGFIMIGFLNALCRGIDRMLVRVMLSSEPGYVEPAEEDEADGQAPVDAADAKSIGE